MPLYSAAQQPGAPLLRHQQGDSRISGTDDSEASRPFAVPRCFAARAVSQGHGSAGSTASYVVLTGPQYQASLIMPRPAGHTHCTLLNHFARAASASATPAVRSARRRLRSRHTGPSGRCRWGARSTRSALWHPPAPAGGIPCPENTTPPCLQLPARVSVLGFNVWDAMHSGRMSVDGQCGVAQR